MSATFFCFNCKRPRPIEEKVVIGKSKVRCVHCMKVREEAIKKKQAVK